MTMILYSSSTVDVTKLAYEEAKPVQDKLDASIKTGKPTIGKRTC
ncbi:unnamed protein product, partial [marine sediment metagenome]